MASGKKVFIVGPGFIGWNVLDLLVAAHYSVSALVRREEHGAAIEKSGATAVKGIHTSGTSVLDDNANGAFKSDKIYHDNKADEINSVPDDAPHREIDLAIVKAQKELGDKAKLAIMIPPLIYGYNPAHERLTIQIPTITRFALKHGYAGYVGKGLSVESQVHVMDLARAYIVLLHHMESSPPSTLLSNPYYFCENGHESSWLEVAQQIGKALHAAGKLPSSQPKPFPEELFGDLFRSLRLRELGWAPREKGIWESYVQDELPVILAEQIEDFNGYKGVSASGRTSSG